MQKQAMQVGAVPRDWSADGITDAHNASRNAPANQWSFCLTHKMRLSDSSSRRNETGTVVTVFVALLRAINVGGTGKLPMAELCALCGDLGFKNVRTYIQSGNVVFASRLGEKTVKAQLEDALARRMGKPVAVMVRSAAELRAVLDANPYPKAAPAKLAILFLPGPVPRGALQEVVAPGGEEVRPGARELYIHYPNGLGRSKLKLPKALAARGTARNLNTVAKLATMAEG